MAKVDVCDASGQVIQGDAEEISELAPRVYAAGPARDVRKYMKARDELLDRLAHDYAWGLLKLREEFRSSYPNGKLPDEF